MIIGIVGSEGIVGGAVSAGLERLGHTILRHDLKLNTELRDVVYRNPAIIFVCVPTPSLPDGRCDVSIVEETTDALEYLQYTGIVAIKSTVEPSTTQRLYEKYRKTYPRFDLAFVPEFLRERSAFSDFVENHDLLLVGTPAIQFECNGQSNMRQDKDTAARTYKTIVEAHGKYPKKVLHVSATEAELTKYFSNVFNALRVTWANAFYDVCKALGADYDKVKGAAVSRGTINDLYLDCNENFRGFGGPCLPKETAALAALATKLGLKAQIFRTIMEDNRLWKTTVLPGMRE